MGGEYVLHPGAVQLPDLLQELRVPWPLTGGLKHMRWLSKVTQPA